MQNFYSNKLKILKRLKIYNPELDLRLMINSSLKNNNYYFLNELNIKDIKIDKFNAYFKRRIKGEPISKILNNKEFWGLNFYTNKNVLDPRPETELIIEAIIKYRQKKNEKLSFCDLGTGSGCIIISLLKHYHISRGVGIDISKEAIKIAKKNSIMLNVSERLKLIEGNWNSLNNKYDIIFSNPPYVNFGDLKKLQKEVKFFDPTISLNGGIDGLEKYRDLSIIINQYMKNSSIFLLEIGQNQMKDVEKIFYTKNLQLLEVIRDLQGIERVMVFKKTK